MSPRRYATRPAVERGASGAAALFDGNNTADIVSWMFWNDEWEVDKVPDLVDQLMEYTVFGHMAWVVFPPYGFRL